MTNTMVNSEFNNVEDKGVYIGKHVVLVVLYCQALC